MERLGCGLLFGVLGVRRAVRLTGTIDRKEMSFTMYRVKINLILDPHQNIMLHNRGRKSPPRV